jgi:CHASE3 domain sensor protein
LALVLIIAVQGAFATRAHIAQTFEAQSRIVQAQLALEELLRLQIDEESSVRGYVLTRDPFYAQEYASTAQAFDAKVAAVASVLAQQQLNPAARTLEDYVSLQTNWRRKIAQPLLASPGLDVAEIDKENKAFSDYENRTANFIRNALAQRNDELARSTQEQIDRDTWTRTFFLALFGLLAILFNGFRSRLVSELEEERTTTEILQRAFRSEHVPLPNCEVGSAYLSASSHLAVGGDVFDVYRLSDTLAMAFIADVSGKGVDAAVLTAFIKFTIRGIALRRRDPGAMLAEFNTAFAQTVENPYLFVSLRQRRPRFGVCAPRRRRAATRRHRPSARRHGRAVRDQDALPRGRRYRRLSNRRAHRSAQSRRRATARNRRNATYRCKQSATAVAGRRTRSQSQSHRRQSHA